MGLSANTLVLTDKGYALISTLRVGTRLPTPLGLTSVVACSYVEAPLLRSEPQVLLAAGVTVLGQQGFLTNNLESVFNRGFLWSPVFNALAYTQLVKLGLVQAVFASFIPDRSAEAGEIYTLEVGTPDEFVFPEYDDTLAETTWFLGKANHLAVVGPYITAANCVPWPNTTANLDRVAFDEEALLFNTELPAVSQADLTLFSRLVASRPEFKLP